MKHFKTVALLLLFSVSLLSCRERIDSANVGLLIKQYGTDKGQGVQIASGTIWYNPWTEDVVQIPAFVQHVEFESFTVNAQGGSEFTLSPQLNYYVQRDKVTDVYRKYRRNLPDLEKGVIKTIIKETYRVILNNYSTDSIMNSRARIEAQAMDSLRAALNKEGFTVERLTSGLYPPKSIVEAIDAKNAAVQVAMRIDNEVKATEAEARKKVAKATGDAEAFLIDARAKAEGNRLKQQTLTPLLVQQQFVEAWDGHLPQYGAVPQLFKQVSE